MALHPSESSYASDRTQPVPSMADGAALNPPSLARSPPAAETTGERTVLICAFDAPAASLIGPDEKRSARNTRVTAIVPDERDTPAPADPVSPAELIQSQALELAANRAEIARQERAQEELQRAVRLRDGWLQDLRTEIKTIKEERRSIASQLSEAQAQIERMGQRIAQQDAQISTLQAEAAERMSVTAFASGDSRVQRSTPATASEIDEPSMLEPLDHDASPIPLNRKTMTVGRTRDCDVCVPSALVSRDHARIFVRADKVVLVDTGSINGCFVNDQVVRKHILRDGDILRFADCRYRYSTHGDGVR